MFERYTEKARRVIFFARYEASRYGSPDINSEHLLLGLLREDKALGRWLPKTNPETIAQQIDDHSKKRPSTSTSVDLPLSPAGKRILKYAADEADRLSHRQIGTQHLFLGILDEEDCFAAKLMREGGADPATIRPQVAETPERSTSSFGRSLRGSNPEWSIEIHGVRRNAERIHHTVERYRMYNWHWVKRAWTNIDVVVARKTGKVSFDLSLESDSANFELVKGGWKKDRCVVCRWELFESAKEEDVSHANGYTNGHEWLCLECYARFWEHPNFFSSTYSDIT